MTVRNVLTQGSWTRPSAREARKGRDVSACDACLSNSFSFSDRQGICLTSEVGVAPGNKLRSSL